MNSSRSDKPVPSDASDRTISIVSDLKAAGAAGDAQALMQLAVWHLTGTNVERDIEAARGLLRRAVEIGHVDGALMEVALVGNGNGNLALPDWSGALALLHAAAADNDHVAAAQIALVERMAITNAGMPTLHPQPRQLRNAPRLFHYEALLTPEECAHLATVGSGLLEPAHVIDPSSGRLVPHPVRSSDNGAIGPTREDLVVRAINLRIAAISETTAAQGEPLTVLRYREGQRYKPHVDTIAGAENQRIRTVLIYLNQGFRGGETHFPALDLSISPRTGDAVVFDTLLANGASDPTAVHSGEPVTAGAKWIATRWIRAAPVDPWTIGEH